MEDVDELTKEFLAESLERLDRMDRCLTELEQRPADKELLGEIFRSVHTIKGSTGFLGLARLEKLAHAGETLLASLRDGRLAANAIVIGGLLQLMDGLRTILRLIELTGGEGSCDEDSALIALIHALNVGQEVAAKNASTPNAAIGSSFARRLDSVTCDLRETVMQARMLPVGHVFGKFPRMVRDLALRCGKQVRMEFSGQEMGLDKSLLDAIKDPLMHAVRNAIDHGIEEPRARALAGKPVEGALRLRAYHHNGSVVFEVEDDGGGISTARVLTKAVERGMVSDERAAAMTEREALQLIFIPGFSTAATVTNVSGRGVGMDVVRANVEKAGGTLEIESREGKGTMLRLRVPLTKDVA